MIDQARLEHALAAACTRYGVPGAVVGLLDAGKEPLLVSYGVASRETGCVTRSDTRFQIGSISKIFTTTLALQLVERGQLALDEPITTYMPELRLSDADAQQVLTLRHLLTHTSGILGDYFADFGIGDDALARYVDSLHTLPQLYPPGTTWSYCNSGFSLAGRLIEVVTGQSFESVMRERIFEPLQLTESTFFAHEAIAYPVAVGHSLDGNVVRRYALPRSVNPAGGIIGTVRDLLRFAAFHLGLTPNDDVLSSTMVQHMQEQQTVAGGWAEHYGLGWALWTVDGERLVGHGGSTSGFEAHLVLVPARRCAWAILTNHVLGSTMYREFERWLLAEWLGLQDCAPALITMSEAELARFAGTYHYPLARVTVTPTAGSLRLNVTAIDWLSHEERPQPPFHAVPIGPHTFLIMNSYARGLRIEFDAEQTPPAWVRLSGRVAQRVA